MSHDCSNSEQRPKGDCFSSLVEQGSFLVSKRKSSCARYRVSVGVVSEKEAIASDSMGELWVNSKMVRWQLWVKSKCFEYSLSVDFQHGTCVFHQETDEFGGVIHLEYP